MPFVTDREILVANALDSPTDDTIRLVLADLLRESDVPEEQARGRFLWGGVTAATFRNDEIIEDQLFNTAQGELVAVTTEGDPARWLGSLGLGPSPLLASDWFWDCTYDRVTVRIGDLLGIFTRGMLSELSLTLGEWYAIASKAFTSWPLERVSITDVPGLSFIIERNNAGWCLRGRLDVRGRRVPLTTCVVPLGVAPSSFLLDAPANWVVEEQFATRVELVDRIGAVSAQLVDDLRETAGDRWPSPPRKRRR